MSHNGYYVNSPLDVCELEPVKGGMGTFEIGGGHFHCDMVCLEKKYSLKGASRADWVSSSLEFIEEIFVL